MGAVEAILVARVMRNTMPTTTSQLDVLKLPKRKLSMLLREAKREGISPEQYVRDLVEERLAIAQRARTRSLFELSRPIREALGHLSETEIDAFVDRARGPRHPSTKRRAKA